MKNESCVFCRISEGAIPAPKLHEDPEIFVIRDIQPHARIHLLVIPRRHIASLDEAFPAGGPGQALLLGRMFEVAAKVAREAGLLPGGFRSIINTGPDATQTVHHLHLHVIGGQQLSGGMV